MLKFTSDSEKKQKYFTISVYCLIYVSIMSLIIILLRDISAVGEFFSGIIGTLSSLIYGCLIALALKRLEKFIYRTLLPLFKKIFANAKQFISSHKRSVSGKKTIKKLSEKSSVTSEAAIKRDKVISLLLTYVITLLVIAVCIASVVPAISSSYYKLKTSIPNYLSQAQSFADGLTDILPEISFGFLQNSSRDIADVVKNADGSLPNVLFTTVKEASQSKIIAQVRQMDESTPVFSVGGIVKNIINGSYTLLAQITPTVISTLMLAFTQAKNILLGLIISVYLLGAEERLYIGSQNVLRRITDERHVFGINELCSYLDNQFIGFICRRILHSVLLGLIYFFVLWCMNFEFAPIIALVMGLCTLVPYIGVIIGLLVGAFIAVLTGGVSWLIFSVCAIVIQLIDSKIIEEFVPSLTTFLEPVWILVSVTVFGGFLGITGMLIAVPLFEVIIDIVSMLYYSIKSKKTANQSE